MGSGSGILGAGDGPAHHQNVRARLARMGTTPQTTINLDTSTVAATAQPRQQ